jgi:hypothetical protein
MAFGLLDVKVRDSRVVMRVLSAHGGFLLMHFIDDLQNFLE